MHTTEIHHQISSGLRREIDRLIFEVWQAEAKESQDVEILVQLGTTVLDPLDASSSHVIVRSPEGNLIGYGRVTICENLKPFNADIQEISVCSGMETFAYISRLVVHPEFRERGIATAIHQTRIEIARSHGISKIYGWAVGEKPRGALAKSGFRETERRRGFKTMWYQTERTTRLVERDIVPIMNRDAPARIASAK
jgi:GNAT superfamily N-acetyltransferase